MELCLLARARALPLLPWQLRWRMRIGGLHRNCALCGASQSTVSKPTVPRAGFTPAPRRILPRPPLPCPARSHGPVLSLRQCRARPAGGARAPRRGWRGWEREPGAQGRYRERGAQVTASTGDGLGTGNQHQHR